MALSYDEIAEILKVIDASSCEELVVETGDVKLVVRRKAAGNAHAAGEAAAPSIAASSIRPAPAAAGPPAAAAPPSNPIKTAVNPQHKAPDQIEVVAPMVGTFYRAPSPAAAPFVDVGSIVRKGDPLCLIEVMKLFTTIASEHDGRIVQIGAENGELVEYGRALFVIEPA